MSSRNRNGSRTPVDQFSSLKEEVQHETSVLLSDRDGGRDGVSTDGKKYSRLNTTYTSTRTKDYPEKVNGVINLVENDRQESGGEYRQVIAAEKEILDLLLKTG